MSFYMLLDYKAAARKFEHENNDLRFLNNQYVHKIRAMERESKEKSDQMLKLQEKNFNAVIQTPGKPPNDHNDHLHLCSVYRKLRTPMVNLAQCLLNF